MPRATKHKGQLSRPLVVLVACAGRHVRLNCLLRYRAEQEHDLGDCARVAKHAEPAAVYVRDFAAAVELRQCAVYCEAEISIAARQYDAVWFE